MINKKHVHVDFHRLLCSRLHPEFVWKWSFHYTTIIKSKLCFFKLNHVYVWFFFRKISSVLCFFSLLKLVIYVWLLFFKILRWRIKILILILTSQSNWLSKLVYLKLLYWRRSLMILIVWISLYHQVLYMCLNGLYKASRKVDNL